MPTYLARDETKLAYQVLGQGNPLICLPGGPMQNSGYLADLGGLSNSQQLIRLDLRATGRSQTPQDLTTCRCDRMVADVEALREHLGLDQLNLLAHSAGANLAALYTARHPNRINKLILVTPSTYAVGGTATAAVRRETILRRRNEPWFDQASAAFERIAAGEGTDDDWTAIVPCTYGRWDATAQAHHAAKEKQQNPKAATEFGADGAYDPPTTRAALATVTAPVLLLAGELDLAGPPPVIADYAALFPNATFVTQPAAGHFPWLDDPTRFTETITTFLT